MIKLYQDSDLWDAVMQRRRLLAVLLGVTAVYLFFFLGGVIGYSQLPYQDPNGSWIIAVTCIVTALYVIFLFPFMGICYKRCHAYCRMLQYISVGLKECSIVPFAGIEDWTTHDGVDVNVATFEIRNVKRDEVLIREIYIDGEKDYPPFQEGDIIKLVTQGNLLVEYEILEHR